MQFYRLFTHKTNTQDIKSNCFICTVSSFTQRLFTVRSALWIHNTPMVTAANPYLRCTWAQPRQGRAVNARAGPRVPALTSESHSVLKAKVCSHLPKGDSKQDCVWLGSVTLFGPICLSYFCVMGSE